MQSSVIEGIALFLTYLENTITMIAIICPLEKVHKTKIVFKMIVFVLKRNLYALTLIVYCFRWYF